VISGARDRAALTTLAAAIDAKSRSRHSFAEGGPGFDDTASTKHLGGEIWRLLEPLHYRTRGGMLITMPSGMVFDGASIPRLVWPLLPSKAACLEFGSLHDWMYRVGPSIGVRKRHWADDIGWEALVLQKIGNEWQRDAIWEGLKIGGGPAWRRWRARALVASDPAALDPR
jgi:hypothetical protein